MKRCVSRIPACLVVSLVIISLTVNVYAAAAEQAGAIEDLFFMDIPIVTSAGFFSMSAEKAPGYSTVVSQSQIEQNQFRSLTDILERYVPGVYVENHESVGISLGMRGLDANEKTLVLYNGNELNHRQADGFTGVAFNLPLLGDTKSVEVINGPGAIMHGSGAINGFVNIVSKNGTDNPGMYTRVELEPVSKERVLEAGYGKRIGEGKDLFIYGGYEMADGVKINKSVWGDLQVGKNVKDQDSLTNLQNSNDLFVQGSRLPSTKFVANWRNGPLEIAYRFTDINSYGNDAWVSPNGYETLFHDGNMALMPKYTCTLNDKDCIEFNGNFKLQDNYIDQLAGTANNRQMWRESNAEIEVVGKTTRFSKQQLAVGVSGNSRKFENGNSWWSGTGSTSDQGGAGSWKEYSIFGEDVIQVSEPFIVSLGLRVDGVNYDPLIMTTYLGSFTAAPDNVTATTKRIATAYTFNPETTLRASYQEGFRFPDAGNYTYVNNWNYYLKQGGYPALPSPTNESMNCYEVNFHRAQKSMRMTVDVNAYLNTYKDEIMWRDFSGNVNTGNTFLPATAIQYIMYTNPGNKWMGADVNGGDSFASRGGEFIMNWQARDNTNVMMNYSYSQPYNFSLAAQSSTGLTTADNSNWTTYPTHMVKACVTSNFMKKKWETALSYLYNTGFDAAPDGSIYHCARQVVNVAVSYNINKRTSVGLAVVNLLGSDVPRMAGYYSPYDGSAGSENRFYYFTASYKLF